MRLLQKRFLGSLPSKQKVGSFDLKLEYPNEISLERAQRILNVDATKDPISKMYTSYRNHR